MFSIISKKYLLVFGLLLASACTTNDLELKPTSVITNESFWKDEGAARGALYGMYVRLRNDANVNLFVLGEARAETISFGIAGSVGFDRYYENTLDPITGTLITWQSMYATINAANQIIQYVPGIPFAVEANKNDILAQAYTMRAFMYYVLVRSWGDVPVRTQPVEGYDPETVQIERTPVAQVFDLIKADLDKAIALYPTNNFPTGRSLWSRPAANTLKADVHLWTGKRLNGGAPDFTKALEALNAAQAADAALLPSYASVFDHGNKGNREILMAVRYDALESVDNYYANSYLILGQVPTNLDAPSRALVTPPGGQNIYAPSPTLRAQFPADDPRRNVSFRELFTVNTAGQSTFFTSVMTKGSGTLLNSQRVFSSDVILYRFADLLLMRAEAKNALGQDPSTEINLVRARAFGNASKAYVNAGKEANDEAILQERLFELAFEGKRWWDLLRFGKAFEKVPSLQKQAAKTHLLLFPISINTLNLEPRVKQNPGY